MPIYQFPGGEKISEASLDHTKDQQDFEELTPKVPDDIPKVVSDEEFDSNLYLNHIKQNLADPHLKEMPDNVLGIKNGSVIQAMASFPEIGLNEGEVVALFNSEEGVRLGSMDSTVVWPLETIIKSINDKLFENEGDFQVVRGS